MLEIILIFLKIFVLITCAIYAVFSNRKSPCCACTYLETNPTMRQLQKFGD